MKNLAILSIIFWYPTFASAANNSGLVGRALQVPICSTTVSGPAVGKHFNVRTEKGALVTTFKSNNDGSFRVNLNPGSYRISSSSRDGVDTCLWSGRKVKVSSGRYSSFGIVCHRIQNALCINPDGK